MIVLLGTAWPTLQIARHSGAEPVLAFLLALLLCARVAGAIALQRIACLLLPWVHPTGGLIALAVAGFGLAEAVLSDSAQRRRALADAASLFALAAGSLAGVIVVWNHLYHGHWWGGGYATQGATRALFARSPVESVAFFVSESLLFVPVLLMLAVTGALAAGREGLRWLALSVWLLALHLLLFAIFTPGAGQEPARRLSVVWLVWGLTVGLAWDRLRLPGTQAAGLLAINALLGFYWFELREWNYYPAGDGAYYPLVLWVTLALREGPTPRLVVPVVALTALALVAARRLWRLLAADARSSNA
jgi:hypothetical protein